MNYQTIDVPRKRGPIVRTIESPRVRCGGHGEAARVVAVAARAAAFGIGEGGRERED
jgi:hypothetical protein